jgi:hypothetical protein
MRIASIFVAMTIMASSVLSANAESASPLLAGKPAGVKEATLAGSGLLIFFGLAVVGGGIALVASQGSSGGKVNTTTTTATAP